jgi:hypothetical protein
MFSPKIWTAILESRFFKLLGFREALRSASPKFWPGTKIMTLLFSALTDRPFRI